MHRLIFGNHWAKLLLTALLYLVSGGLIIQFASTAAFAQSEPVSAIPVGDGPYALEITPDGKTAIVSLLFPAIVTFSWF